MDSSSQLEIIKCHTCSKLGHIARFCRNTGNAQQRMGGQSRNTHHRTGNNRRESGGNRNNSRVIWGEVVHGVNPYSCSKNITCSYIMTSLVGKKEMINIYTVAILCVWITARLLTR